MSTSVSSVKRSAAGVKRKHPRTSIIAASAAVAGVLGSAGFALASAPSAQAAEIARPAQAGSQQAAGHYSATAAFDALTGTKSQFDATRQAAQPAVNNSAKLAPAKPDPAKPAATKPAAAKAAKPRAAHAKPYAIYDSVTPSSLPDGKAAAVYANGAYAASASQVAGHKSVLWIDTNGSKPGASVLDVEPGDATPAGAAHWVQERLTAHPDSVAVVYTMMSDWQQVKDHVADLPSSMQSNVRYWIADPTGVAHIVPGADATQWYWGSHIDISSAQPSLTQTS